MPFGETRPLTRPSGPAERWLRRIFIEDWNLKLLALAITLVLWFIVSAHGIEREVIVEPRIEGKPAPTYEVQEIVVTPTRVRVRGPADQVNALKTAPTQTISIEGRRESFDALQTRINISDPKVDVLETVTVHVSITATGNSKPKSRETN